MRIFAISDIHIDYPDNWAWCQSLSDSDYQGDAIIIAGDLSDDNERLRNCFKLFTNKFSHVCFTPGNHELWVRKYPAWDSIRKLDHILELAESVGVHTGVIEFENYIIAPLFSWYDFSFGEPEERLLKAWMDFRACTWPEGMGTQEACEVLMARNCTTLKKLTSRKLDKRLITFSHFVPSVQLIPRIAWPSQSYLFPVFGSTSLLETLHSIRPDIHIYGHSHLNIDTVHHGIRFVNNAFAYPSEAHIARKALFQIA